MNYARISSETLDFKPDHSLEAWYFDCDEPDYFRSLIVGWEIQAETILDTRTGTPIEDQPPLTERPRYYVMIDIDSSGITGVVDDTNQLWKVVPRGTPDPHEDEVKTAWTEWKAHQDRLQRIKEQYQKQGHS